MLVCSREKNTDGWFVLREKYCCLAADKPSEQGQGRHTAPKGSYRVTSPMKAGAPYDFAKHDTQLRSLQALVCHLSRINHSTKAHVQLHHHPPCMKIFSDRVSGNTCMYCIGARMTEWGHDKTDIDWLIDSTVMCKLIFTVYQLKILQEFGCVYSQRSEYFPFSKKYSLHWFLF
jgi:hypothetical protein